MDLTLVVVSCGPQLEIGLAGGSLGGVSIVRLAGRTPRSTLLLAAADLLIEDAGVGPEAIQRVAVTRGPGSFTGIRSGLATAQGLAAALRVEVVAVGSLKAQAARAVGQESVWAAQPGRRGEVYAQCFEVLPSGLPEAGGDVEVLTFEAMTARGPWICPDGLKVEGIERAPLSRSSAEAVAFLVNGGLESEPLKPEYVEGPPIHGGNRQ